MKQHLIAMTLGVVLLGALVAFALLPGAEEAPPAEPAADPVAVAADRQACREFGLGLAAVPLEATMQNLRESLEFERSGGDGGTGFHDWLDAEQVSQTLLALADAAAAPARVPGASDDVYDALRGVVEASSALESSAVSGSVFMAGEVADHQQELADALADVERACA